jgi:Tfp pilus assembly protein PilO
VPFELELDGSYFGVVRFFEQIGKMDRLVSVSGLNMANVKTPSQAKVKKTYKYAPGETVVATCTASAFFSPKAPPPPPPQAPKVLAPKK